MPDGNPTFQGGGTHAGGVLYEGGGLPNLQSRGMSVKSALRLEKVRPGDAIRAEQWNAMVDVLNRLSNITGSGDIVVRNTYGGISIGTTGNGERRRNLFAPFLARIKFAQSIAANRWRYGGEEVAVTSSGIAAVADGITFNVTDAAPTLNLYEIANTATGVQGNSVDVTNLPGTFKLHPVGQVIGAGTIVVHQVTVQMWHTVDTIGQMRYVFWYPNAIDGACP